MRFLYSVWFRNEQAPVDDEDREWVACFLIDAATDVDARSWGDHLAKAYSSRKVSEVFLSSEVETASTPDGDLSTLPIVPVGHEASDQEIGW